LKLRASSVTSKHVSTVQLAQASRTHQRASQGADVGRKLARFRPWGDRRHILPQIVIKARKVHDDIGDPRKRSLRLSPFEFVQASVRSQKSANCRTGGLTARSKTSGPLSDAIGPARNCASDPLAAHSSAVSGSCLIRSEPLCRFFSLRLRLWLLPDLSRPLPSA
jgi:hypothetical protein